MMRGKGGGFFTSCLFLLMAAVSAQIASGATVRGKLVRPGPNGSRAAAGGVRVTVVSPNGARSSPAVTGQDGMYYLYNIGKGTCRLEVWVNGTNRPPRVYQVQVNEPYTDVPPVSL
jgi:hypothetical protein